jgi:nitrogen regulatory protein P-II 1
LYGRGSGIHEQQKILGIPIEPEKEIVLTLTYADQSDAILKEIVRAAELQKPGYGLAFVLSVDKVAGTPHVAQDPASEG